MFYLISSRIYLETYFFYYFYFGLVITFPVFAAFGEFDYLIPNGETSALDILGFFSGTAFCSVASKV
jgi:hypothetical protein